MPPILYLIDGHALAYRTYFALTGAGGTERWLTRSGQPTAGIYGFASALLRLLEQEHPEYLAVAFDTGKTFRDEIYPEYKATRAKMPDDLRSQMEYIRDMIDRFGFPRLEMEGFEADDVLGSMAKLAISQGFGIKILTGDRDLLQLVNDRVIVNLAGSKLSEAKDYTTEKVAEYMGVLPNQIVDYKALVGDSSDNIPGVSGIGDKTATNLLAKYQTLDNIYAHLEELAAGVRTKLEKGREMADMSRQLATIRTDLKISIDIEKARVELSDLSSVEELFQQLEFKSLVGKLRSLSGNAQVSLPVSDHQQLSLFGQPLTHIGAPSNHNITVHTVTTPEQLQQLVDILQNAPHISLDTETTSINPLGADIVGISLATQEGTGYYIPLGHKTGDAQLPLESVINALRPIMQDAAKPKIGHHLKYDALILARYLLPPSPLSFDTMIAGWLVDPGSHRLGLKDMAEDYLQIGMTRIEELIGKGKSQLSMADIPVEKVAPYAAADAEIPLRLRPLLLEKLNQLNAINLFNQMEMPLIPVLIQMEQTGIALDISQLKQMSIDLSQRINEIEQATYRTVGYTFNINSTQQLSKVLFETLNLKPPRTSKTTASGHISTKADVLEELIGKHPVVDQIIEYRELAKLRSTYVDALPTQINPTTGRIHTSYHQTGSVTGRLASTDPNLQNIPTRTDIGRRVRQAFVAAPQMTLLSIDYSQIELRIIAHMSGDQSMIQAFHSGQDIHATTAAAIYGTSLDQVTKEMRRHAKAINFGLIYGMSSFGLSRTTDLTLSESETFVKAYFDKFPQVKKYLTELRQTATQQGFVETLFGRRRYFPNLRNATNQNVRNREEREAINAPIQGTAADIMKLAMIHSENDIHQSGLHAQLLLQVHDELVIECQSDQLLDAARVVQNAMENVVQISVPLSTEARSGSNWGNLTPLNTK